MSRKARIKILIDVCMTGLLLFLMGYPFWGQQAHELAGASMFVLFLLHHGLNWQWYKTLFRGRYTPMRVLQLCVALLVLADMLILMYSGIVLSRYVFAFLPVSGGLALARRLHILGSFWGFLLMSVHLGLHWYLFIGMAKKKMNLKEPSRIRRVLLLGAGAVISVYGATVFVRRDFLSYLLLKSEFVFFDYGEPVVLFYLDYLALMGLCIAVAHCLSMLLRRVQKRQVLPAGEGSKTDAAAEGDSGR